MKINFHRVLLGFFENWDKSPQKKWDKGGGSIGLTIRLRIGYTVVKWWLMIDLCRRLTEKSAEDPLLRRWGFARWALSPIARWLMPPADFVMSMRLSARSDTEGATT